MPNGIPDPRFQGRPQPPPSNPRVSPGPLILLIIIYLVYIGGAIIAPLFVTGVADQLDPQFPPLFRLIGSGVLFIVLAIFGALLYRPRKAPQISQRPPQPIRTPTPQPAAMKPTQQVNKFKPVTQHARKDVGKTGSAKPAPKGPQIFTYPAVVEGGIFGDTYIEISDVKIVKVRSLVVEPQYLK